MKLLILIAALVCQFCSHAIAQAINEPQGLPSEWSDPYQPFRIVGNLYYVGTYDLASYLIITEDGNILINPGLADSESIIKDNIATLGFAFEDIKILLTTQAHFDHVGAMAAIKKQTGASMWANGKDAPELASGGSTDYELGKNGMTFKPIEADRHLLDGDTIQLGTTKLIMLHHPGHTKGSSSYLFDVNDGDQTYRWLIANMPSIITDRKFTDIHLYRDIAKDYAYTFDAMKKLKFDLFLSSHASQFGLDAKHKPGDPYNPNAFIDQKGYDQLLKQLEEKYKEKMKEN